MRRTIVIVVMILGIGALLVACGETRVPVFIRVGTDATNAPFESVDANNKIVGFDAELIQAIANRSDLNVQMVNVSLSRLITGIAKCEYEGAISMLTIDPALKNQISFSEPYLTFGQVVVVKKGNIIIKGRDTMSGMVVGTQTGTISASEAGLITGVQVKFYDTYDLAFQDLVNGYIDAVVAGYPRALSYVNIKANNLKLVGDEFGSESFVIAICKQRADLLAKINEGLAAVKKDGTLDKLKQKWLQSQ